MKKKIIIAFFISIVTLGAFAQNPNSDKTPEERASFQTEWMTENLTLFEEQVPKIDSLNLVYAKKMEALKEIQGRFNQLREAKKIAGEKEDELKQILTKDQFKIYQDKKSELREKMKEMSEENR
ncbi:hypothetical protein GM418_13430 [Maribellus comscasis]|uniref:DUF4890 domain-containing protein n=1 Tax=Maribellus comscasis TaxID=2681766 RepID=A0A6I6JUA4_9BACT|nr:hypothetical protein [Maribellus comscasis]QGY44628.1 hypothetical protein GM418_13430 [Maribellus comscasis]